MRWWKDSGWSAISSVARATSETAFEDVQLDLRFFYIYKVKCLYFQIRIRKAK